MSAPNNKYKAAVKVCLKVLACTDQDNVEYMDAMMDFGNLVDSLQDVYSQHELTEGQYLAIQAVVTAADVLTEHEDVLRLFTDKYYLTAPEWDPTKAAARKALTLF